MSRIISHNIGWSQTVLNNLHLQYSRVRSSVIAAKTRRDQFRATFSELNALSDRDLADIGIPRSHIRRLAFEAMSMETMNETS